MLKPCIYGNHQFDSYLHWAAIFPFPIFRSFLTTKTYTQSSHPTDAQLHTEP